MQFTTEDEQACKHIAILMLVAKILEKTRKDMTLTVDAAAERAAKSHRDLLKLATQMYSKPGQMEQEVIAFAKRMGFEIEQQYLTVGSDVPN